MLLKEKRDSNHEWEEKVHRKNISKEGQSITRFGQWDVCESLRYKVLYLRRYDCQLEKEQERDYKFYFWIHKSFLEKTCVNQRQRQGHRWKNLQIVRQHSLSKHSHFWPNFANQSSTSGDQHWFERFQGIEWLVGGVSQAPLYTISFVF